MRFRSVHAVAFILLSAYCLIGCDFAVFDDLVSCPQGVSFHFYRQTPCEQFPNYPSDIRQVRVFAFDANGVLVGEFSDKKYSFQRIIPCLPHYSILENLHLSHGVAVT